MFEQSASEKETNDCTGSDRGGRVIPRNQNKSDVDTEIHAIGGAFDTENK